MSGEAFLDTNIFVYIRDATIDSSAVVSYQVIHEFFNVVLVKSPRKMPYEDARLFLETVFRPCRSSPRPSPWSPKPYAFRSDTV
jgi:predicted nucleic acid-binding protein